MSTTPNQKDLLAKKSDLEGILKPDDNDILHLPNVTITLAESGQFYLAGIDKKLLTLVGDTSGNAVTLDGDAGLTFTTSGGSSTITGITSSNGNSTSLAASQTMVSAKQDALTAGTNITISNNTISATDTNTLSDLTDTAISSLADGQVLKYNATSGKWVNGTGGGGAEVILGTTAPTAAQGSNGNLYIQYDDTNNNTVTHEYVKISGAWEEIAIGGGGGSTTTVTVTPKVLTGTNIADITVGNGNTTDIYDYAYFDGSGYYETPFIIDTDHKYEITFEANYDNTMAVIGTYAGANYFHLTIYYNNWYVGTNSGEVRPSAYTTGKHTFKTDSSHTYLDDTQFTSYTPAIINNYITIGARENTYLYKGKFYEFKIKSISTGNVLYDLVPGIRGTTKGLYDLVSDTFVECSFITNMGTKTGTSGGVTTQLYAPSIEANPSGTATDSLSSIEIDGTIYSIEGGGGSSNYTETTLFTGGTTSTTTFELSDNIINYDAINFIYKNEDSSEQYAISNVFLSSYLHSLVNDTREILVGSNNAWYYYLRVTADDEFTYVKSNAGYVSDIIGIKFGGGGGGDASPNITLLNNGTITDGQYVLSEPISNFDEINFIIQYSNEYINSKNYYPKDLLRLSSSSTDPYGVTNFLIEDYGQRYLYCQYIDETHIKPLEIFSVLKGIYGIKYKGGSGASALANLADVDITSPSAGQGLIYDATNQEWINGNVSASSSIDTLTDVDLTNLSNGQILKYNSTTQKWENANESGGGGGEAASLQATVLYNTPITTTGTYTLADDYTNYDFISIRPSYTTNETDIVIYPVQDIINAMNNSLTITQPVTNSWFNFTMSSNSITIPAKTVGKIESIIGYKIIGGGGSASAEELTTAEYEELTPAEKTNGTIYFINDPTPAVKAPVQLIERVSAADSHITSSSSSNDYPAWAAFNGTDSGGKRNPTTNTIWMAATGDTTPWIQYHFDESYYLTKLEIHIYSHYSPSGNGYQGNLYILGSNDGSTWTNISSTGEAVTMDTGPSATSDSGSGLATVVKLEYDLNDSQKYEYIRLQGDEAWNVYYGIACDFDNIYVYGGTELDSFKKIYYMNTCYLDTNPTPTSSVSYSNAEQEIGTWVDGSPLYQKTIYTSSMSNHSNIIIDSSLTTNNIDYFMGSELSYIVNNSYRGSGYQIETKLTDNGVVLDNNNAPVGVTSLSEIYTTVRYTKQAPKNITLLHFEGDLTDSCGTIWNVRNTSPVITTDQAKFGTSSLKFGGNGYIYSDVMTKFKFGTSDFTIDAWLYPTSTARQAFFSMAPVNGGDYRIGVDMFLGSSANQWFSTTGSNWSPIDSDGNTGRGTIALSTGIWQHVALVRSGTRLITFIDGQIAKENTISASASVYWGGADTLRLGSWGTGGQNGGYLYSGYMDEFRIANYAAWTAAFTPPTEPYS